MKIAQRMDIKALAALMGPNFGIEEAYIMKGLLLEENYIDTDEVDEEHWDALLTEAFDIYERHLERQADKMAWKVI